MSTAFVNDIATSVIPLLQQRIRTVYPTFDHKFPTYGLEDHQGYNLTANEDWLAAFSAGLLWLTYASTRAEDVRMLAESLLPTFEARLDNRIHINHDLGFLFLLSARAQWILTGNQGAFDLALRGAEELLRRFNAHGGYIQAWGELDNQEERGRFIIDCMMNIPLLFWAGAETGQRHFTDAARRHADTTRRYLMRPDGSSYHTYFLDPQTGEPIGPGTHQGYATDSLWARGQAWAIYGFAVAYAWTGEQSYRDTARLAADRFLQELPDTGFIPWDLRLPPDAPPYPDSSAGAIAAGGLLRLAAGDPADSARWRKAAEHLLQTLVKNNMENGSGAPGLLRNGTYHAHKQMGVDTYTIFGDYFFLEALTTVAGQAPDFWGPAKQSGQIHKSGS